MENSLKIAKTLKNVGKTPKKLRNFSFAELYLRETITLQIKHDFIFAIRENREVMITQSLDSRNGGRCEEMVFYSTL